MHPLSILTYYARNKRKALPVLGILALAVFGISLSLVLTGTLMDAIRGFVSPYYKFIVVQPLYRKTSQIDPGLRADIRRNPHLASVLPEETIWTYDVPFGIQEGGVPIFGVRVDDMPLLLDVTASKLIVGRMPRVNADELVLNQLLARRRGLWVGSEVGRDVDLEESLSGKWTVVGILSGETSLNLAPLERVARGRPAEEILLIPRPGEMNALVDDLERIKSDRTVLNTPAYYNEHLDRVMGQFDAVLTAINIVIIIVLSLGVGLLNMIYFRQRLTEFGLLGGIGYSRVFLVRRVTLEALALTALGWLVGIGLATTAYQVLNFLIFDPQGNPLNFITTRTLGGTLPIPVFVWLFSTATIMWQLSRLDPVTVIERRD